MMLQNSSFFKVDTQADQLEKLREKYHEVKEECRLLSTKLESSER